MGTTPLSVPGVFIETDQHYTTELALKNVLLKEDHAYCFAAMPGSEPAQWEALMAVLNSLAITAPDNFRLSRQGDAVRWRNDLLNKSLTFSAGQRHPYIENLAPLDWVGRQVQEDLLILDQNGILVAGQLCFPSGWALHEKLGKNFMSIHEPLPAALAPMLQAADKLMERIPAGKPLQRNNWGLRVTDQLDLSSRHSAHYRKLLQDTAATITSQNAGHHIYIRIEHQTLTRLPNSNHILFTLHTYQNKLALEINTPEKKQQLCSFLQSVPAAVLDYKLITPLLPTLIPYLTATP